MERTTPFFSHKLECYDDERDTTRCLNGGTCFAIVINNGVRDIGCSCMPEFRGLHCDQLFIDLDMLAVQQENLRTASIAAGVSACILIVFVILLSIFVYLRIRRNRPADSARQNTDMVEREDMRNNNPAPDKENEVNWLLKKEVGAGGGGVRNGAGRDPPGMIPLEDRRSSTGQL